MKTSHLLVAATLGVATLLVTPPPVLAANGSSTATTAVARAASTPKAVNGKRIQIRLKAGIDRIPQRADHPAGYVRSKFKLWDDANHDCQNTRSEVLRQEAKRRVTGKCAVKTGLWISPYDHMRFTQASQLDIDHLVPLAEAWRSGARSWSAAKREAYANDLTDKRTLIAVSAHSNRAKSDSDPAQWLPEYGQCSYVTSWVAVKLRWRLSADAAEKTALKSIAAGCTNTLITVRLARVKQTRTSSQSGGSTGGSTGGTHACTLTSSGSCIRGGEFCPQASYGQVGYDAYGNSYICGGDSTHPRWG